MDKNQHSGGADGALGKRVIGYIPAPDRLPGFPYAQHAKPMGPKGQHLRKRWADNEHIYEWDSLHGRVEKYDLRGRHLGEFDPETGARLKPPKQGRRIMT